MAEHDTMLAAFHEVYGAAKTLVSVCLTKGDAKDTVAKHLDGAAAMFTKAYIQQRGKDGEQR